MAKLTPIQLSFSAGEISPLMYMRSDTKGYQQGLAELENMFADSRGAARSRAGTRYIGDNVGNDGRILALPVNDNFFYSLIFLDKILRLGSMVGHSPTRVYNTNGNFNQGSTGWLTTTDGNTTSTAIFSGGKVDLHTDDANNRFVYVTQEFTIPATGDYSIQWSFTGNADLQIKIGTAADDGSIYDVLHPPATSGIIFTAPVTTMWMTIRLDSSNAEEYLNEVQYFGIADAIPQPIEFITPYEESDLKDLQGIQSPSGGALYVVHEKYPPYKVTYDRQVDAVNWLLVEFVDDAEPPAPAQPPEWVEGSYPSCGDFFEGRLWLGGTVNEPQTFWASKSGLPETFVTVGTGTNADDPLQFTMAKYGRIEWMVGFKNLVIGTQNGEHIVTSDGGFIAPDDIKVEQQSSYGSANIQPVQVGDQIFYVSADGRKLRSIQYEWQKDNWLSKDLTFNSEHITKVGIKHITWQQNPNNLFHCVLTDGTVAVLTYERSHDVYGWSHFTFGGEGKVIDFTTGAIQGTDFVNALIQYRNGILNYEVQPDTDNVHFMDSWVDRFVEPDLVTVTGLEHLEGSTVQVLIEQAAHPDRIVIGGQIVLQYEAEPADVITVGLQYNPRLVTLPFDRGSPNGSGAAWQKRWNKIFLRLLDSTMPLVNGERQPERFPSTPMNVPQPPINEEILKINLGFSKHAIITIEQDLPHNLVVLGIVGEAAQSIT